MAEATRKRVRKLVRHDPVWEDVEQTALVLDPNEAEALLFFLRQTNLPSLRGMTFTPTSLNAAGLRVLEALEKCYAGR